jgi:SAM-dependent methyltransferase
MSDSAHKKQTKPHHHSHDHGHGHPHGHPDPMGWEFDEEKLEKLRDPERLKLLPPDAIWAVLAERSPNPLRVLVDLGTGIGFFAIPFARKMPDGLLYACDVSAESLAHLREALRREGVGNIEPVRTEHVRVPLADSVADCVVMINLHHHLESRPGTLAECWRLLKPGGCVAAIDWRPIETEKGPPMEYRIEPATVRAELEAAGFQAVSEHAIMREHWCLTGRK